MSEYAAAETRLSEAAADAAGDRSLEAQVSVELAWLQTSTGASVSEAIEEAERAIPMLEDAGDDAALARAWWISSWHGGALGDYERGEYASRRSLEHARRAGDSRAEREALWALTAVTWGPMSVAEGFARLDEVRLLAGNDRIVMCHIDKARGALLAMSGEFAPAHEASDRARAVALDLGLLDVIGLVAQEGWLVEMLAGEPEAAERIAREALEVLDRAGNSLRFIAADELAQALYEQGRLEEAEEMSRLSEEAGMAPDDPFQSDWQRTRGKILARRGEFGEAERLVREGVKLLEPTQYLSDRGLSMLDLTEVLRLAGRPDEAAQAVTSAIDLFERKGNVVSAERARRLLYEIQTG